MNFIKSSILSGISTIVKLISNLVITKLVAFLYGAKGMFLLGNLANFLTFARVLATGGVEQGVVKYVAQNQGKPDRQKLIVANSVHLALISSTVLGLFLILFRDSLSSYVMMSREFNYLFLVIGCTSVFFSINLIFLSILNGLKELKRFIIINIAGNLFGLAITLILLYFFDLEGILLGFCINQSIVIVPTIFYVYRDWWIRASLKFNFQWSLQKDLFRYSIMAITSAITVPLTFFLIRRLISLELGSEAAGMWEALVRISAAFLMVLAASYSTYLLPTFSALKGKKLKHELMNIYKIVIPVSMVGASMLYIFRDFVIIILYSEDFLPISNVFIFQMLGDAIKAISLITGYLILSRGMVKAFIANEILQMVIYLGLTYTLINNFKIEGATIAYFVTALSCFIYQLVLFRKVLWQQN
ncbi:hypothetical protein BST97_11235 [Nonlabens spongiae]|uniref:O-antigen translocase n=1 Tax=Nonlabens spongiae TaxID=331648 RepID=A0A1W6MLP4_9FLAO|nr:O-antigen translocase [Nonlabens spongiae]ARN78513.1 hypothetical protein BST97_11235 [Nonlabens spongiae]